MKELALLLLVVDFHSDIRIAKNGELTVTERITIEAKGGAPGLQRELPGAPRIVEVIRNGHPEPYVLEGNRLRTGSGALAPGRHRYQIVYRGTRHIAFGDYHDELLWSVSGLAVERATAEVTLPSTVPRRDIRVRTDHESFVRDGRAAFRTTRPLGQKEAMIFAVRFPKDIVAAPGFGQQAFWFWDDYKGLLGVLALLAFNAGMLKSFSARVRIRGQGHNSSSRT
ncbi:MAG: DUF2207 domain-containing protein [Burkholderiales bacterium]